LSLGGAPGTAPRTVATLERVRLRGTAPRGRRGQEVVSGEWSVVRARRPV